MSYDIWHDLAEQIYMEFILECMDSGELMVSQKDAIRIIEKKIKEFAKERIIRIFFTKKSEEKKNV